MKQKLTILLLALGTSIGAWAQVTTLSNIDQNKCYTVTCNRSSWAVANDGTNLTTINQLGLAFSSSDTKQQFAFVVYNGEYYLWSVNANKFVTSSNTLTNIAANAEPVYFADASSHKANTVRVYFNEDKNINVGSNLQIAIDTWKSADDGCAYTIAEAADFDPSQALEVLNPTTTLQYVISDNGGTVFTSGAHYATIGETITTLPSEYQRPYCSYSVTETTIVAGENTIPVTVTYNLPFTVSTSFADATWYYATIRSSKYLRADEENKDTDGRYTTSSTNDNTDVYKWAFFGNPYSYFYIVNKGQGEGKYLYAGTVPEFQTVANPSSTNDALWEATANSSGFSLRSITGTYLYINDAGNAGNLGYWNSASGANDGGSMWTVEEVPSGIDVTYDFYIGGEKVKSVVVTTTVNSEVSIPSSLTANYSPLCYDFATSGIIGEEDCTINVTGTKKTGIVAGLGELSNSKAYKLTTARGDLYIKNDHLASNYNANTGAAAGSFAIINFEGNYYLYSTESSKFVQNDGSLSSTMTSDVISISFTSQSTNHLFLMKIGTNGANVTNTNDKYELVINSWTTADEGNQYAICEVGDFDAADALAELDKFSKATDFANAIAALKAIPFGTGLNEYSFTGAYASYTVDNITSLESAGYSPANLAIAQGMLANYTINLPTTGGFYRIKAGVSGKYITGTTSSYYSFLSLSETPDNTTIIYYDGTKLLNYSNGLYSAYTSAQADAGGVGDSYTFAGSANRVGYYTIYSTTSSQYMYDSGNTEGRGCVDRQGSLGGNNTDWTIETVTALPITMHEAGGAYYGTINLPVAVTLPDGLMAYSAVADGDVLTLTKVVENEVLAANQPVILYSEADVTELDIATGGTSAGSNELSGTIAAASVTAEDNYVLGMKNSEVGFYLYNNTEMPGFKAYLPKASTSNVKAFSFNFNDVEDAIRAIESENSNLDIYDIAGRRVQKAQKGMYIVNGKKVMFK